MSRTEGWRPLTAPVEGGQRPRIGSPFAKLARAHVASVSGDALVAMSLAGSLFFSIEPGAARGRIALYLLSTMAPFAVIAPLIGPAMDRARGGYRLVVVVACFLRSIVAAFMAVHIASDSLWLFPEAFAMLVLGKTYAIAKAAVVPGTIPDERELVEANSKLQLLSGVSGALAAIPGGILLLFGPELVVGLACAVFAVATVLATRIDPLAAAPGPPRPEEKAELRSAGVVLASSGMGVLRGTVGFVTFLLAFELRGESEAVPLGESAGRAVGSSLRMLVLDITPTSSSDAPPTWYFGAVLAASVVGGLVGAALAPRLRAHVQEEKILLGALATTAGLGIVAMLGSGLAPMMMLSSGVAASAGSGKQAFDALVQRDAPDAVRGRSFARFESRFQILWVLGAFVPVLFPVPMAVGGLAILLACGLATASYLFGFRAVSSGQHPPPTLLERTGIRARWSEATGDLRAKVRDVVPGLGDDDAAQVDDGAPLQPRSPVASEPQAAHRSAPTTGQVATQVSATPTQVAPAARAAASWDQLPPPGVEVARNAQAEQIDSGADTSVVASPEPTGQVVAGDAKPVQPTLPFDAVASDATGVDQADESDESDEAVGGHPVHERGSRLDDSGEWPDLTWAPDEDGGQAF